MANPTDVVDKLNELFEDDDLRFDVEDIGYYFKDVSIEDYSLEDAVDSVHKQEEEYQEWLRYSDNENLYYDLP